MRFQKWERGTRPKARTLRYDEKEVAEAAQNLLSKVAQHHDVPCGCGVCKAWLALYPVIRGNEKTNPEAWEVVVPR